MSPDISAPAGQKKPIVDFDSDGQKEKVQMTIAALLVVLSVSFLAYTIGFLLFQNSYMTLAFGLSIIFFAMGTLWYFTVVIQQAVRKVQIRIVEEKTP